MRAPGRQERRSSARVQRKLMDDEVDKQGLFTSRECMVLAAVWLGGSAVLGAVLTIIRLVWR